MTETTPLPTKFYVRSGELSAIVLAVTPSHAAARLIQMLMVDRLNGLFEPTIQVSQSGRADDAEEFDSYDVFVLLGVLSLNISRERFEEFFFPEE